MENAYFPLFVSQRALTAEKDHVEGFAPEVRHHVITCYNIIITYYDIIYCRNSRHYPLGGVGHSPIRRRSHVLFIVL